MGSVGDRRLDTLSLVFLVVAGAACAHRSTTTLPRPASFELREVIASEVAKDALSTHPFTTGVVRANDPVRNDPAFAEGPPDAAGDLVTFADTNGDGFYTAGRDPKYLLGPAGITAADVDTASALQVQGGWAVQVQMDGAGTGALRALTGRLVGRQLAVVFERLVISAPTVQSAITSGQVQVTANFDRQRAKHIAAAIQSV